MIVLAVLCADLLVSAGFLLYAFKSRLGAADVAPDVAVEGTVVGRTESVQATHDENGPTATGPTNVDRQIDNVKEGVKSELSRQTEKFNEILGKDEGWVTLKELENISKEAYDSCIRQLEFERGQSARKLEKRRKFIAELRNGFLTEEEMKEFREALEFLNECDECKVKGIPMPNRSAEYSTERWKRLQAIARKYCCAVCGCPEEAIAMHDQVSFLGSPGASYYMPILPKNVSNLKYK